MTVATFDLAINSIRIVRVVRSTLRRFVVLGAVVLLLLLVSPAIDLPSSKVERPDADGTQPGSLRRI